MSGRIRTIKPSFFLDESLAALPALDRLVFIGLWCHADKQGRMADRPRRLAAQILPYEGEDFEGRLSRLEKGGFICRYSVDEKPYIQVQTFTKHQRTHHTEPESDIPGCPEGFHREECVSSPLPNGEDTVNPPLDNRETTDGREGKGREGKGMEGNGKEHRPSPSSLAFEGEKDVTGLRAGSTPVTPAAPPSLPFEEFWKIYPKKLAKLAAEEAWKKLTAKDQALAIAAVPAYAAACAQEGTKIKHAQGWLNGRRWNDELFPAIRYAPFQVEEES